MVNIQSAERRIFLTILTYFSVFFYAFGLLTVCISVLSATEIYMWWGMGSVLAGILLSAAVFAFKIVDWMEK